MCLVRLRWKRQRDGPQRGLEEIRTIADSYRLTKYPFRHAALGEFELRRGKNEAARVTSELHSRWHATLWSGAFSNSGLTRVHGPIGSGYRDAVWRWTCPNGTHKGLAAHLS
jgi:hypothetical protein